MKPFFAALVVLVVISFAASELLKSSNSPSFEDIFRLLDIRILASAYCAPKPIAESILLLI